LLALRYHEATKHHFDRFARSLGYLDWATQPSPFRRFDGAPLLELPRRPLAERARYEALFDGGVEPRRVDLAAIGEFLRCSMGLSAWKQFGASRWALRVNPSSGNLHPTETYVVWQGRVHHYAVREHALEQRSALDADVWRDYIQEEQAFLVALTSIHWREAWKYGERAFRYCQHDAGHAIGALRLAASLLGWRLTLLPRWSDAQVAALLGVDRVRDYVAAEPEEPECVALVSAVDHGPCAVRDPSPVAEAAARAVWQGTANQLSPDRIAWPLIDEVAAATRYPGNDGARSDGAAVREPAGPMVRESDDATVREFVAPSHSGTIAPPHSRTVAPPHHRTVAPSHRTIRSPFPPQRPRVRWARNASPRRVRIDASAPAAARGAVGRDRLVPAGPPGSVRPPRGRGHTRPLCVSAGSSGGDRMADGDAPGISLGAHG
jgi:SagB-type dehydrogenase family enzyme